MAKNKNIEFKKIEQSCTEFSAEKFVEDLLTEGENATCDENSESFSNHFVIPPFYDEILYKRGQRCFHNNISSLLVTSLLGLMVLGCRPALKILILIQQQSTPLKAYKRYVATILHVLEWYNNDFQPGSKSWRSLDRVRKMHNSASKLSHQKLNYRINQLEMALTQFGFIGFALIRGKFVGLHSEEDLEGLIHLWRTIGYALGIEDRFNIFRESMEETKEICEILLRRVFIPGMQQVGEDFYNVGTVVAEGFKCIIPGSQLDVFLHFLHMVMDSNEDVTNCTKDHLSPLDKTGRLKLKFLVNVSWAMQYRIVKFIMNNLQYLLLWFLRNFPIAAYWKFGHNQQSLVKI